jgi:cobalt-zinc-cadmium efflux system outer membrane protein
MVLSLRDARVAALRRDPALRAAREAVTAAVARERQAAALPNPSFAYGREQTSRAGQSNAQDIAQIEWPLDVGGQRAVRLRAARLRREAAEARLNTTMQSLDAELLRAYIDAMHAVSRVQLAAAALRTAREAERVSIERERAGDMAGYAARRMRLESGRYAARRAEAAVQASAARERLALLTGFAAESISVPAIAASDTTNDDAFTAILSRALTAASVALPEASVASDSLVWRALAERSEILVAQRESQAAVADAQLASRERIPMPSLSAGYKGERVQSGAGPGASLSGFVAGFSIPLPLLDRRGGIVAAADATARQVDAEADVVRRRVRSEVQEALSALRSALAERALLQPFAGIESRLALRAVQAAYAEGEIPLTEWLGAVRAWQETELALLTLSTDIAQRRIALARAAGIPLFPSTESIR